MMCDKRLITAVVALLGMGCANPGSSPWQTRRLDTDAGRGPTLVIVESPTKAAVQPPLVAGYRVIRLLEPDEQPDPPSWRQALGLGAQDPLVIAFDADGAAVARQLALEAGEQVKGVVGLGGTAVTALTPDAGSRWPSARVRDVQDLPRVVSGWLRPGRRTFTVQP